jgi:hypothetical protein
MSVKSTVVERPVAHDLVGNVGTVVGLDVVGLGVRHGS